MIDRMELLAVITLGFLLDQVLGDPHWLYHPVRLIGAYISFLEKGIRRVFGDGERALIAGGDRSRNFCDRDDGGGIRRHSICLRTGRTVAEISRICNLMLSAFCGAILKG